MATTSKTPAGSSKGSSSSAQSSPVSPSVPPPRKSGGGNWKYIVIGLIFLGAAFGLWMLIRSDDKPLPPPPPRNPLAAERVNPMAQQDLVLEPEKDAGVKPTKTKIVYVRGDWDCSGTIAAPEMKKVMEENRQPIRACYERRLKNNNVLQGSLILRFKVNATGEVAATMTGGTLGDGEVFSCVRNLAKKWRFPAPAGDNCAVVQVPFQFTPRKQ